MMKMHCAHPQHQVVILDSLPTKTGKGVYERTTVLQLS